MSDISANIVVQPYDITISTTTNTVELTPSAIEMTVVNGYVGATGATGPIGATGATGPVAATGATGPIGSTGATGPIGASGATGPIGSTGATGVGFKTTSTTSLGTSTGSKTLTVATGLPYIAGQGVLIAEQSGASNLYGVITSYNIANGQMVANIQRVEGSGTHITWNVDLMGLIGATGPEGATGPSGGPTGATGATGATGVANPGGANTEFQFNNAGNFGATGAVVWDNANSALRTTYHLSTQISASNINVNNLVVACISDIASNITGSNGNTEINFANNQLYLEAGNANIRLVNGDFVYSGFGTANAIILTPTGVYANSLYANNGAVYTGSVVANNISGNGIANIRYANAGIRVPTSDGNVEIYAGSGNVPRILVQQSKITLNTILEANSIYADNYFSNTGNLTLSNGNVTANYFIGNGSQLSGIDTTAIQNGSANVRAFANANVTISANGVANVVTVTNSSIIVNGAVLSNSVSTENLTVSSNTITLGNASGSNGNFSVVIGAFNTPGPNAIIIGSNNITNANVFAGSNSIVIGRNQRVIANNSIILNASNSAIVAGVETVYMKPVAQSGSSLTTVLGYNPSDGSILYGNVSVGAGSYIENGNSNVVVNANSNVVTKVAGTSRFDVGQINSTFYNNLVVNGNINATATFNGLGTGLSGLVAANIVGTVANATFANTANIANTANRAGTVTTNAQPNITSVGTLSSLAVTGNITSGNANLGNLARANFFQGNGSLLTGVTVTVANTVNVANGFVANTQYLVFANGSGNQTLFIDDTGATLTYVSGTSTLNVDKVNAKLDNNGGESVALDGTNNAITLSVTGVVGNALTISNSSAILESTKGASVATDTTISHKIPIVLNGVTYYIALTTSV